MAEVKCGHSACRQNYIDTGETECVLDGSVSLCGHPECDGCEFCIRDDGERPLVMGPQHDPGGAGDIVCAAAVVVLWVFATVGAAIVAIWRSR